MGQRRAIIFHGTGAHPEVVWLPWLRRRLTARGFAVEVPHHPGLDVEPIASFLPKVLTDHTLDANTVLVGHSAGAALLLAVLERIDVGVDQAVLVAGYCTQPNTDHEPVLKDRYDWAAIRAGVRDLYFINSRDDPYGCDDKQGRAMFDRLGGTQIVRDDGHFGDVDQPYGSFELLDRLIARPAQEPGRPEPVHWSRHGRRSRRWARCPRRHAGRQDPLDVARPAVPRDVLPRHTDALRQERVRATARHS